MTFLDPSLNIALQRMQHIIQQMRQRQTDDSINFKGMLLYTTICRLFQYSQGGKQYLYWYNNSHIAVCTCLCYVPICARAGLSRSPYCNVDTDILT